jgi:hypothetical protein
LAGGGFTAGVMGGDDGAGIPGVGGGRDGGRGGGRGGGSGFRVAAAPPPHAPHDTAHVSRMYSAFCRHSSYLAQTEHSGRASEHVPSALRAGAGMLSVGRLTAGVLIERAVPRPLADADAGAARAVSCGRGCCAAGRGRGCGGTAAPVGPYAVSESNASLCITLRAHCCNTSTSCGWRVQ